jgi:hypothetical protein
MSAECSTCGSDLVYGPEEWPQGHCEPCRLRSRITELEAQRENCRLHHIKSVDDYDREHVVPLLRRITELEAEVERLRDAYKGVKP